MNWSHEPRIEELPDDEPPPRPDASVREPDESDDLDADPAAAPADDGFRDDGTGGMIPTRNPPALAAYYCGVFSLIPCFPIGFAGLVLGVKGLRRVRADPRVKGTVHAWIGIVLGSFFGLIWLVGTVLAVVAIARSKNGE